MVFPYLLMPNQTMADYCSLFSISMARYVYIVLVHIGNKSSSEWSVYSEACIPVSCYFEHVSFLICTLPNLYIHLE